MSRRLAKTLAVAIAVVAALGGYGYLYRGRAGAAPPASAIAQPAAAPPVAVAALPAAAALPGFSGIVERYGPAVVNVSTVGKTHVSSAESPFGQLDPSDPLYPFFRRFLPPDGELLTRALGSGFIVKPDGVILTNAHVVAGASEVKVKLTDKREFHAKVIGVDETSDVAVLKIDAKGLPTVEIGAAARPRVGQWVLAIGSPFGFENSATAGIISGESRSLPGEGYVPFLQTDVAVNPGNSGGPLFDTQGDVIGINSQIYSRSGGYMGLSFAIPIDVAMEAEQQIVAHGKVIRGWLGVAVQDVDQPLAESFGLARPAGALVSSVEKGSPAARAGVQPGDVILALNGKEVAQSSDLPPRVADLHPGASARLEVWRDRRRRDLEVRVGQAKGAAAVATADHGSERGLGLAVRPLTPEEQAQVGAKGGVVVEGVQGPAARAGIQPGDVVLALNGTPVTSVDELRRLVAESGTQSDKHVALLVERGEARIFVPIDLG